MSRHYLLLVFAKGKEGVRREYFDLLDEDESEDAALTRWVESHPSMIDRVRNRDRTASALRASPLYVQLCHPSSWWRAQREAGLAPIAGKKVRRG